MSGNKGETMNLKLKMRILEVYKTQSDFAHVHNIDESKVSRVVQERKKLTWHEKAIWAEFLNCKVKDIFGEGE